MAPALPVIALIAQRSPNACPRFICGSPGHRSMIARSFRLSPVKPCGGVGACVTHTSDSTEDSPKIIEHLFSVCQLFQVYWASDTVRKYRRGSAQAQSKNMTKMDECGAGGEPSPPVSRQSGGGVGAVSRLPTAAWRWPVARDWGRSRRVGRRSGRSRHL
jgi:hypothetical protein